MLKLNDTKRIMIITKNRIAFAKACFTQGARLRPKIIDYLQNNEIYEIMTYGGLGTWKSLVSDAMICGITDHGSMDMLRDKMMFESNNVETDNPQDGSLTPLFKFFQLRGQTICVAFSSSQNFVWNHMRGEKSMKQQILEHHKYLKKSDLSRLLIFANTAEQAHVGHSNIRVQCPEGQDSNTRCLTFS